MENNTGMETSPLTKELYSIDWAVRFDEFQKHDETSYTDLHQLLAKIENIVESEIDNKGGDLNDIKVLKNKFSKSEVDSPQWHRLSMLIHLKIVLASIPKGLTATATLSAIQIMGHLWKVSNLEQKTPQSPIVQATPKPAPTRTAASQASRPAPKPAAAPAPKQAPKPVKATTPKVTPKATQKLKPAANNNKNNDTQTENVVIKKLAEEAGLEDKNLATRCYEVASTLADEYPEYTLTAIRVMTAEKLGVTRQFVENLDIKPAKFKNG
jgi:hypothetical protein